MRKYHSLTAVLMLADIYPSTGAADLKLLMQKLAAIDAVTTKEEMYKKMGELMIEGYYTPFILVPSPYQRTVEIFEISHAKIGINAESSTGFPNYLRI